MNDTYQADTQSKYDFENHKLFLQARIDFLILKNSAMLEKESSSKYLLRFRIK